MHTRHSGLLVDCIRDRGDEHWKVETPAARVPSLLCLLTGQIVRCRYTVRWTHGNMYIGRPIDYLYLVPSAEIYY